MFKQFFTNSEPKSLLLRPGVLAVIQFTEHCSPGADLGVVPVGFRSMSGAQSEVIQCGSEPVERGLKRGCQWSQVGNVMFAATWIPPDECENMEMAAERAYKRLFELIRDAGYCHPFRIWNFIPNINQGEGDEEIYKKFCVGRHRAFKDLKLGGHQFPAASALGNRGQGAVIYLLAHKDESQHHENPRQEPAYCYPRQYGPSSPSFARATSLVIDGRRHIFVSGTASIIGHDTKAAGDLTQQIEITLLNIRHLVESIDPNYQALSALRIYIRRAEDFERAQSLVEKYLFEVFKQSPDSLTVNYLLADICRDNLLIEIEAATAS